MESTNGNNDFKREPKEQTPLPLPVQRAMASLGHNLALARRRRHWTQASLAERIQASRTTVQRMEQGDPRVPIQFFAKALFVFGELPALAKLLDTAEDNVGLTMMDEQLPQRVRRRKTPPTGAL